MEFYVGEDVRFTNLAAVSLAVRPMVGTVDAYEEVDGVDYVVVGLRGPNGRFDQWVLPGEIVPANLGRVN